MTNVISTNYRNDWETPPDVFKEIDRAFGPFSVDLCATKEAKKCSTYYSPEMDALANNWTHIGGHMFMNPPYGKGISAWVKKASEYDGDYSIVALLPNNTDTKWFRDYVQGRATIHFVTGRIQFLIDGEKTKNGNPGGSIIAVYRYVGRFSA